MVWLDMQCLYYYLELQINNHNFHTLCVLCYRFVNYMTCILQIYLRLPMFINTILVVITFSTGTNKARKLLRYTFYCIFTTCGDKVYPVTEVRPYITRSDINSISNTSDYVGICYK